MKLSYEEWAALAAKQCESEGDVQETMMEVAVNKGDWLNRWYSKEGKEVISNMIKVASSRGEVIAMDINNNEKYFLGLRPY